MNEKGFTLIETVMVIVILGIIGAGMLMYFASMRFAADPAVLLQATSLAGNRFERIIADKKANGFNSIVPAAPAPVASPFDGFTQEAQVFCVQEADLDANSGTMPDCSDSDIHAKRVQVIVTWAGGSVDVVSVITNH